MSRASIAVPSCGFVADPNPNPLPGRTGALTLHPRRAHILLDEPRLIDPRTPPWPGCQVIEHVAAHVISDAFDVLVRRPRQPMRPVRGQRPRMLSQRVRNGSVPLPQVDHQQDTTAVELLVPTRHRHAGHPAQVATA